MSATNVLERPQEEGLADQASRDQGPPAHGSQLPGAPGRFWGSSPFPDLSPATLERMLKDPGGLREEERGEPFKRAFKTATPHHLPHAQVLGTLNLETP